MPGKESDWFRITCVFVVAMVALPPIAAMLVKLQQTLATGHVAPPQAAGAVLLVCGLMALLGAAGFALACWNLMSPERRPSQAIHWLLALELVGCFFLAIDLVHLVSVQAAATLPWRQAWRWQAAILCMILGIAAGAVWDGSFEATTGLGGLPQAAQVAATIMNVVGWSMFAFVAGRMIVAERREREELALANCELVATRDLLAQSARLGERVRISRELHDTLGHHLTALAVNLDLAMRLPAGEAQPILERSRMLSGLLLNDVRETVGAMRSGQRVDLGPAFQALASSLPSPRVHLELAAPYETEDTESAHVLLRCAQESLTNAMRHSQARNVWIDLRVEEGEGRLRIRDDGRGAEQVDPGNGLRGMKERVEALGGRLELVTGRGQGFAVSVSLPWREAQA